MNLFGTCWEIWGFPKLGQSHLQLPLLQKYASEPPPGGPVHHHIDAEGVTGSACWRFIAAHFKRLYRSAFHSVNIYLEFYMKLEELWILLYVL